MAIIYSLITVFAFTISNIFFRVAAKDEKKLTALSVIYGLLGGLFSIPFMFLPGGMKLEITGESYYLIGAIIGWSIFSYLIIWVNNKMEASTNALLSQTNTVFSFLLGVILIAGSVSWMKIFGLALIVGGNVFLFVGKAHVEIDKPFWVRLFLSLTLALTYYFDNIASRHFGIGLYAVITYTAPSVVVFLLTRMKISDIVDIIRRKPWEIILISLPGAIGYHFMIKAYSFDDISVVIPVVSASTILTVIASGIFLKEKRGILKKVLLALFVFSGVVILGLSY